MGQIKRILALAVGDPRFSQIIDRPRQPYGVRPYISGLVEGLTALGHGLGTDFDIDYRQNWHEDVVKGHAFKETQGSALIYAMSTTVMRAAGQHTKETPVVFSNCSDHKAEQHVNAGRATGFSAKRTQTAGDCFDRFFKTVPTLKQVFILHKPDYDVSDHAVNQVTKGAKDRGVSPTTITVTSHADLQEKLAQLPARARGTVASAGVHVTPVDLLFAATPTIIRCVQEEKNLPAFFPVTDWVPSGLGGYGVSQYRCGERTAGHVHQILWPDQPQGGLPEVLEASEPDDFEWVVSSAAANALQMEVPTSKGMRIV